MNEDQIRWWNHETAPEGRWREQGWAAFWLIMNSTMNNAYCVAQRLCDDHYVVVLANYYEHEHVFGDFVDLDEAKLLCIAMNKMEGNYGC